MAYFLLINTHKPKTEVKRQGLRPTHVEWITSGGNGAVCVLTGAPTKSEKDGSEGNFFVLDAASKEDAERFAFGDPFVVAGFVQSTTLKRLHDVFSAESITKTLSPRL